jgi:Flp pilus assembly protein TadG
MTRNTPRSILGRLAAKASPRKLFQSQTGTMSVMTALAAVPMLLVAGTAIDMVRFNAAQTQVQAALDAATLSGASLKDATDAERITAADKAFLANIEKSGIAGIAAAAEMKVDGETMRGTADLEMPLTFMKLAGIPTMSGHSEAEVGLFTDKNAEIVLVLDYSGSMGDEVGGTIKYVAMREAAKKLVADLAAIEPDKVKFGLVPFSHHVYTTLPSEFVLGGTGSTWTGCTQDRPYPLNLSDATPTTDNASKWNQPHAPVHAAWGCAGYVSNNLATVDLGNDFTGLVGKLNTMLPYAWTHIALGVEFGYHMLSPNAPFTSGAPYSDKNTRKYMVVLTDGMQTEPGFGPGSSRNVTHGENNLESLCESAKLSGITIMTMAFDLDDTSTRQRLQDCATDPTKDFFVANDGAALADAFNRVKDAITADVYLSR